MERMVLVKITTLGKHQQESYFLHPLAVFVTRTFDIFLGSTVSIFYSVFTIVDLAAQKTY